MTSDTGDYRLEGSLTGPDGAGNLTQPFLGNSGQIALDPKNWRAGRIEKPGQPAEYGAASGDAFVFDVTRATAGREINFQAAPADTQSTANSAGAGSLWITTLARNLSNTAHTLELISTGHGEVTIEALYIYQPPEK